MDTAIGEWFAEYNHQGEPEVMNSALCFSLRLCAFAPLRFISCSFLRFTIISSLTQVHRLDAGELSTVEPPDQALHRHEPCEELLSG